MRIKVQPTSEATYERARRLANVSMWTISLQYRRLSTTEPEDNAFLFRKWADFDFLIVSMARLRRAARLAAGIPEIQNVMLQALSNFDSAVPHLKKFRDVAEHFDDYAIDQGREKSTRREALEVSTMFDQGPTLDWLGHEINAGDALVACENLFDAIKESSAAFKRGT
jgi:hypothetical protein